MTPFAPHPMPYILVLHRICIHYKFRNNFSGNSYMSMSIRHKVGVHIFGNQPMRHNQNIVVNYTMYYAYEFDGSNEIRSIRSAHNLSFIQRDTLTRHSQHHRLYKKPYCIPRTNVPCCNHYNKPFHNTYTGQFHNSQNNQSKSFSCTDSKLYQ